jgi:hypothetical protein
MSGTKRRKNNNNNNYNISFGQIESSGTIPPRITSSFKNSLIRTLQKTIATFVSTPPKNKKINNNFPKNIKIKEDFYNYLHLCRFKTPIIDAKKNKR